MGNWHEFEVATGKFQSLNLSMATRMERVSDGTKIWFAAEPEPIVVPRNYDEVRKKVEEGGGYVGWYDQ